MNESEFSLGGGGDDDSAGAAVGYECTHEDGDVAICDGGCVAWWGGGDGFSVLCNRVVFAC